MEFLLGNPYSTPVGQCIEKATDGSLQNEDWTLNMEICDIINETEEGPKDAMRAVKKRLNGNRNFREVMLALTVLETCVKNCGHRFHVHVANREFIEGVMAWADAFRSSPDLNGVVHIYEDLKRKGIEFPMADLDALSPIHTPLRGVPEVDPGTHKYKAPTQPRPTSQTGPKPPTAVVSEFTPVQMPAPPGPITANPEQELNRTCRAMQQRIVELISRVSNEEVTEELLHVNDDLNNMFLRYERYERYRAGRAAQNNGVLNEASEEDNLIDLGPCSPAVVTPRISTTPSHSNTSSLQTPPSANTASLSTQLAGLVDVGARSISGTLGSLSSHNPQDDFDMFAHTRSSSLADQRKNVKYEEPQALGGLASALDIRQQNSTGLNNAELEPIDSWLITQGMIPVSQSSVMDDIEEWLCADVQKGEEVEEGVTSEDFDKFLEERAKTADNASPSPPSTDSRGPINTSSSSRRKINTTEDDNLFTL
ncbi:hypothetical protein DNTS_001253 [Danionella cerebrum]|uniref:VHS domain-containing protein n=1 Tax=Danionella cerebrum TaxID=2873325 RepID=A0A553RA07_9TELE|nr:hypothetical protein DNTS_001253 [Danionella translucida]